MSRPAYLGEFSTRQIIVEHLRLAENCHKDPDELAAFIDQLYCACGEGPWALVEMDIAATLKFFERIGAFIGMDRAESDKTRHYTEKARRGTPPPGALAYDPLRTKDREIVEALLYTCRGDHATARRLAGWYLIDGRHRLLAMVEAKKDRCLFYVQKEHRLRLHEALMACDPNDKSIEDEVGT